MNKSINSLVKLTLTLAKLGKSESDIVKFIQSTVNEVAINNSMLIMPKLVKR